MKILKIFGILAAVHLFFFVLIFANPGCSSTSKPAMPVAELAPSSPPPEVSVPPAGANAPVITAAPLAGAGGAAPAVTGFDPNAPAVAPAVRYSPTRPGTAAATAVEVQPVADVVPATTYAVANGDSLWSVAKKNHLTVAELAAANNLAAGARLKLGQKLIIPGKSGAGDAAAAGTTGDSAPTYKVKPGDKLSVIAKRAGTTTAVLQQLNGLKSDTVRAGAELKLPPGTKMADAAPEQAAGPVAKPSGDSLAYVVKPGDTLSTIAKKFDVKYNVIATDNNITDPSKVRAGMTLVIRGWQTPKSAKPADTPPPPAKIPAADQDLDAGLKPANTSEIPVIKIDDSPAAAAPVPASKP
jgi:LysM repeat protein